MRRLTLSERRAFIIFLVHFSHCNSVKKTKNKIVKSVVVTPAVVKPQKLVAVLGIQIRSSGWKDFQKLILVGDTIRNPRVEEFSYFFSKWLVAI